MRRIKMTSGAAETTMIKVGFHVPGTMAAATSKGIELGEPRRRTVRTVKRIQQEMYVDCPGCGTRSSVDFSAGLDPDDLYELAASMGYPTFFDEVERRYRDITFTCSACGFHGGRLPVHI